ncbi:MAG: hypothetical protein IPP85_11310 [Propionivibrio sp.]|nr:hypothetical protein [Propionivibrio sp.]
MTHKRYLLAARQGGVVLMIALIILVALTIGGIALVRSVSMTSIIAGNLAFQQAATSRAMPDAKPRSVRSNRQSCAMSTTALQTITLLSLCCLDTCRRQSGELGYRIGRQL